VDVQPKWAKEGGKKTKKSPSKSPSNLVVCHHFEHLKKGVSAGTGESHDGACELWSCSPCSVSEKMGYRGTPKTGLSFEMAINPYKSPCSNKEAL
jgi:hypothetical protein